MNLIIDIGNTQIKAALFENHQLVKLFTSSKPEIDFIKEIFSQTDKIQNAIVSSVRKSPEELVSFLKQQCGKAIFFNSEIAIPLENLYESKSTLGYDRLAACVGAYGNHPNQNLLVIDAGTAITFDFVNDKAQYIGGCISPGLKMRFRALHEFTQKLPELSQNDDFHLIGKNTNDAIVSGVQNGLLFEVDAYINNLKNAHRNIEVIFTGGDAPFLVKSINNNAILAPEIVLEGLNKILEFNLLNHS